MSIEYCENGSLLDLLRKQKLSLDLKLKILTDVGAGMTHLSYQKIIHK